jgi:glucose/arabinose dehydrogenase
MHAGAAIAVPIVQALGPHVAPLGVLYWAPAGQRVVEAEGGAAQQAAQQWPSRYDGGVFVAEHG